MDLIDKEQALGCFWNYGYTDGTGYDETEMPAYYRLQALPPVAEVEDCISRQDAIEALAKELKGVFVEYRDIAEKLIGKLPSAQPQRIKGRWIPHTSEEVDGATFSGHRCSVCNYWKAMGSWNFCENCGADMRGEQNGKNS